MSRRFLSLFAVLALFVAAGCGDDSESADTDESTDTTAEPAETTTTTEEEEEEALALDDWVEQADEICEEFDEDSEDIPTDTIEEFAEALPDAIELFEQQLEDLQALGAPDEEADTAEEALDLLEQQLDLLTEANEAIEDGDDPEEVILGLSEDGSDLLAEAGELAEELGLEVCAADDETTTDTTVAIEFGAYGSDPDLDALYDDCAGGSAEACDELWTSAEAGTEYYEFGYSCGGVVPEGETEICSDVLEGDIGAPTGPASYGDDPELDALWDDCEDGDPSACDELWEASEFGTEYYDFGFSCGGRVPEDEVQVCDQIM